MITDPGHVYEFANRLIRDTRTHGQPEIAQRLDDAMHLGSSALEILGAISIVLTEEAKALEPMIDCAQIDEVARYVRKVHGQDE